MPPLSKVMIWSLVNKAQPTLQHWSHQVNVPFLDIFLHSAGDGILVPPDFRVILELWNIQSQALRRINAEGFTRALKFFLPDLTQPIVIAFPVELEGVREVGEETMSTNP
jgi:hypothetical protein